MEASLLPCLITKLMSEKAQAAECRNTETRKAAGAVYKKKDAPPLCNKLQPHQLKVHFVQIVNSDVNSVKSKR